MKRLFVFCVISMMCAMSGAVYAAVVENLVCFVPCIVDERGELTLGQIIELSSEECKKGLPYLREQYFNSAMFESKKKYSPLYRVRVSTYASTKNAGYRGIFDMTNFEFLERISAGAKLFYLHRWVDQAQKCVSESSGG